MLVLSRTITPVIPTSKFDKARVRRGFRVLISASYLFSPVAAHLQYANISEFHVRNYCNTISYQVSYIRLRMYEQ